MHKSRARIVLRPVGVASAEYSRHGSLEGEAVPLCLLDHPAQRHIRQAVIRIAAAHVGMRAREPDLQQPVGRDATVLLAELASAPSSQGIGKRLGARRPGSAPVWRVPHISNSDRSRKLIGQTHLSTACVSSSIGSP